MLHPNKIYIYIYRLDKNQYKTVSDFVIDVRRMFGNSLRYNILQTDQVLREISRRLLKVTEQYLNVFILNSDATLGGVAAAGGGSNKLYPSLLYCWETCLQILEDVLYLEDPVDKLQTAWYFLHPASAYFTDKKDWQGYKNKVKTPMDFGTIVSNLVEGHYQSIDSFAKDCRLVTSNCKTYYQDEENGAEFVAKATRLEEFLSGRLDAALQYDRSEQGLGARKAFANPVPLKLTKPSKEFYTSMLEELRKTEYIDKHIKVRWFL